MRTRATIAAHRRLLASIVLAVVAVAVFVLVYFEPQKLFIDDRVDEGLPTAAAGEPATPSEGRRPRQPRIRTIAEGAFQSYEHSTSGGARVLRLSDGSRYLRFEDFETSNGPDVRVYLSAAAVGADGDLFDDDFVELGELKGNIGDQNYAISSDVDLGQFPTAVIWCKRFSVAFGAASLE
jgi:hypothetical protein